MSEGEPTWTLTYACEWCHQEAIWSAHLALSPLERTDWVRHLRINAALVCCDHCGCVSRLSKCLWVWVQDPVPEALKALLELTPY